MRPKGKLFALLTVFLAIGLITASGAFTTVSAERTAEVSVAGDDAALLQMDAADNMDDGAVTTSSGGVTTIDLTHEELNASGINVEALTVLTPLLNVTNNGGHETNLNVNVTAVDGVNNGSPDANVTAVDSSGANFTETELGSGESTQFGLSIDLIGINEDDIDDDLTITIQIRAES